MKKLLTGLILFIISFNINGQTYQIKLKNGYESKTSKLKYLKKAKMYVFEDINGIHKIKTKDVEELKVIEFPKNKFFYSRSGLTPYIVINFENIPKEKLYKLVKDWVKETYKNPDKVIKTEIDNEKVKKIRIEGYAPNALSMTGIGNNYFGATYTIEIAVKDNKIRFKPISLKGNYVGGEDSDFLIYPELYFKKNGVPKWGWENMPKEIPVFFENLANNLKNYILKNKDHNSEDDDW